VLVANSKRTGAAWLPLLEIEVAGVHLLSEDASTLSVRRIEDYLAPSVHHHRAGNELALLFKLSQVLQAEGGAKPEFGRLRQEQGRRIAQAAASGLIDDQSVRRSHIGRPALGVFEVATGEDDGQKGRILASKRREVDADDVAVIHDRARIESLLLPKNTHQALAAEPANKPIPAAVDLLGSAPRAGCRIG